MAHRGWTGLAVAGTATGIGYVISYFRTLRQIVEEPDILPTRRSAGWLPRFGNSLHTAVVHFSIRTMFEPQQLAASSSGAPWQKAAIPLLVSSIVMMMVFWVAALRMVFAMPLELAANWVFRTLPLGGPPECLAASRRALYKLALVPMFGISAGVFLWLWPWKPGKTNFSVTILVSLLLFNLLAFAGAGFERNALAHPGVMTKVLLVLAVAAALARRHTSAQSRSDGAELRFEEVAEPEVLALKIYKDGATPAPSPE